MAVDRRAELYTFSKSSIGPQLLCRVALLLSLGCLFLVSTIAAAPDQPTPQPQARIDLSPLGFHALSASARLEAQANMSLDFLDESHVLVTFNPKKMFTRLPDCPPSHDDRIIHAVVFSLPSGNVVKEADWYMHDHERYLWHLGAGRLLLRRQNSLYQLDANLNEKLLLASPKPFLWIAVTPDGGQIIVERRQDETTDTKAKAKDKNKPAKTKVQIEFLDSNTLAVQRVIKSEGLVNLEALSTGFADVIHGLSGKVWLVRFGPSGSHRENVTRVRSHCVPDVMFSSDNTVMVGRCAMNSSDYSVSSFTVTGHFLWRQHWSEHRYTPKLQRSDDGSRVAVSSIARVMNPVAAPATGNTDADLTDASNDADAGLQQHVQVLNTASGTGVLSLTVSPAALMAQNISLSPEGRTLVLWQGTNLEVYDLGDMPQDERAKYAAAKADVPGLYTPASDLPSVNTPEETTFASIDAAEEAAREQQTEAEAAAQQQAPISASATPSATPVAAPPVAVPQDAPAITFRSSTRIVVEDVVVADSKGHPVTGLTKENFQLSEDGKPQILRSFEEFPGLQATAEKSATGGADSKTSAPPQEAPKLPPNIYTNGKPTGPETGSATIIVLDLLNTPLQDQQRAREQLIGFLKKAPAASEIALCALSSNLRLIQGFTRDENTLIAAVNGRKGGVKAPPWQSDKGLEVSVQLARDAVALLGTAGVDALQRAQNSLDAQNAHDLDTRMRFTLDAFTQLARYLSGIPGRKNLVWLSGSFPLSISPNPDVNDFQPVTRNYEMQIKKATNLLANAHVAVYPVSVKGVETQSMFSAGNSGTYDPRIMPGSQTPSPAGTNTGLANIGANLPLSSRMDRETREFRETVASEQQTMEQVAADTGGKAFYNSNGIEDAINTAITEGSHYYTLSYTPTNRAYDGKFRKVKIALEEKGYHLEYRRGYYAQDPDSGAKDTRAPAQRVGVAAMQQGSPQSRQIVFSTRVVPIGKPRKVDTPAASVPLKKKKGAPTGPVEMQHYGIDYVVDPSDLRFGAAPSGAYHAVLSFMVTAFNDDDHLVASLVSTATSDLKPANYKDILTGGFRLHQELDVPVEAVSLRLGVEDAISSHVGTLEIPLPVPPPPEEPHANAHPMPPIEPD